MILLTESKDKNTYPLLMAKLEIDSEFAERFLSLVESKGWSKLSRVKLGKMLGVSSTCAHFYMRGERLPAIDQARQLCKLFDGICIEWLLTGLGNKYVSEDNNNGYLESANLSSEQLALIKGMIAQFEQTNPAKAEHKALTSPAENVGGGGKKKGGGKRA